MLQSMFDPDVAVLRHVPLPQYAAQVPILQRAGLATVSFDYLGCGRSTKPNDFAAYSAQNIYQDMRSVYARYSQVCLSHPAHGTMALTPTCG